MTREELQAALVRYCGYADHSWLSLFRAASDPALAPFLDWTPENQKVAMCGHLNIWIGALWDSGVLPRWSMQHADLQGARLRRASLAGLDLQHANLKGAILQYARLAYSQLTCADLDGANLSDACLWGADLGGALLVGADLSGANLGHADLRGLSSPGPT